MITLMTLDDLAKRWGVTVERASRRLRDCWMRSLNMGTTKNPEIRFRLDWVEAWELETSQEASAILGGSPADGSKPDHPYVIDPLTKSRIPTRCGPDPFAEFR